MKREWFLRSMLVTMAMFVVLIFAGTSDAQTGNLQRFSITPMPSPSAGVAVFRDHPNKAGIIIESPITNLSFSSNMDGIVDQRSEPGRGRYVLVIEPFTQIIVVDAPGYIQGRFRVGNPAARDVLYYEIEAEESDPELISVIFNVQPQNARLYVDDQLTETNQAVPLLPGTKTVRIEQEGHRPLEDVVKVSPQNILFNYELQEVDIVPMQVRANVPGARVLIDRVDQGSIDQSGLFGYFLYPGEYVLSLQASGYLPANTTIDVHEEEQNFFEFELEPNVGILELSLRPEEATVLINRQDYSGRHTIELAPGRYRLQVENEGYDSHSESIEIELNQTINREITLQPHFGSLQFMVTPGDARVRLVDGDDQVVESWHGLRLLRGLKVGEYTIVAEAAGHQPREQRIQIMRDETLELRFELIEGDSFFCENYVRDIDSNEYAVIQIGEQCWMAENLRTTRYRDGSRILNVQSASDWGSLQTGAWVHYENQSLQEVEYGKLYNWYAVDSDHGLCPEGWHVPGDEDWMEMEQYLGMPDSELRGQGDRGLTHSIGDKLRKTMWNRSRTHISDSGNGSGFSALSGGFRNYYGVFFGRGNLAGWWTASGDSVTRAWSRSIGINESHVSRNLSNKRSGYSVRCIQE